MPKALKAHPGERLDLPDYVLGANEYTQEVQKFLLEREFLDRRSRILDGFRVKVEDQALNPGLITVYNGNSLDRDGQIINNEDAPDDSRSVTLLGASLTFYVEIEFTDVVSDTDARYFWDPTIPNPAPEPSGSEFSLNVATRITPDWRVVTPVSTTGFQQSVNPNSVRIPVGVFSTDGANVIATGALNPGLAFVRAASVTESDAAIGTTALRVVDARIFPATTPFNVTVDFGGATPEARIVTAVDRDNGILTLSVATAAAHLAGSIVRVTSGNAELVQENVDPSSTSGHPDPAQRLWQANELRGSGLMQSKETFGARDDLNLRSLKDEIDFLSAQLREMKFGHPRPDVVSAAPPAAFATRPRYFDRAGSIQGARSNTVSIGNGTTTFGDFNGTTDAVFTAAIAALPVSGGTIYIKAGTYTFANTVAVGKQVNFVGDNFNAVNITNNVAAGPAFSVTAASSFYNLTISKGALGLAVAIDLAASVFLTLDYCVINTAVRLNGAISGGIRATRVAFTPSTAVACISSTGGGTLDTSSFISCVFSSSASAFSCPMTDVAITSCVVFAPVGFAASGAADIVEHVKVLRSTITVASNVFASTGTQTVNDVSFLHCQITAAFLAPDSALFLFNSTSLLSNFTVSGNYIQVVGVGALTGLTPGSIIRTTALGIVTNLRMENNDIECPANAIIIGLYSDCQSTLLPTVVNGNNAYSLFQLARIGSPLNQMTSGDYIITNNRHDNAGSTTSAVGVSLDNTPAVTNVVISGNFFANYNNAAAVSCVGVDATQNNSSPVDVIVDNNVFYNFAASSLAVGVYFSTVASAAAGGSIKVKNNKFSSILSTAGVSPIAAAVYLAPVNTTLVSFEVTGNSAFSVGVNGLSAYGIYLEGVRNGLVASNRVASVRTSAVAGEGVAIRLVNCGSSATGYGVIVSENRLNIAESAVAAPFDLSGALIKASGQLANLKILNNMCSQLGAFVPAGATQQVMVISDQAIATQIHGNRIVSGGVGSRGIIVTRSLSTAAEITDLQVTDNSVWMNASTAWTAIEVVLGGNSSGIEVHDNVIRETNLGNAHTGIEIEGHSNPVQTRSVSVCNNVLSGVKVGALATGRLGISVIDCRMVSVQDNLIDWMEPLVADGNSISLTTVLGGNWRQFNVVGNNVRPCGGAGNELVIGTISILDGQAHSNVFGDAVTAGTINPALAAGGWTYGAAALTNFNKLT